MLMKKTKYLKPQCEKCIYEFAMNNPGCCCSETDLKGFIEQKPNKHTLL